jgi:MFS family permease
MVAHTTSLKYRPNFSAITGGVECMALALGPFLSGAIAHYASWRISFYIIIPSSFLGIVVVFFSIGHLRKSGNAHLTNKDVLKKIDWIGFGISVPMTLTLVLALQWGGTVHAWSNWRIILLLVLAGVLTAFFIFWERRAEENSMIPFNAEAAFRRAGEHHHLLQFRPFVCRGILRQHTCRSIYVLD